MMPVLVRAALFLAGFALWAAFSITVSAGGDFVIREAWDRAPYWNIGVPALLLAQAALAAASRENVSRLPLWPFAGHFCAMLAVHPPGTDLGLLPLALMFIGIPAYAALFLMSLLGRKLAIRLA